MVMFTHRILHASILHMQAYTHTYRCMQTCVFTYIHAQNVYNMTCIAHRHTCTKLTIPALRTLTCYTHGCPFITLGAHQFLLCLVLMKSHYPRATGIFSPQLRIPFHQRHTEQSCATGGDTDAWLAQPILPASHRLSSTSACPSLRSYVLWQVQGFQASVPVFPVRLGVCSDPRHSLNCFLLLELFWEIVNLSCLGQFLQGFCLTINYSWETPSFLQLSL